jgi:protoporphyrinogen oxidase
VSYLRSALFPLKKQETLEQFLINRFGRNLYQTFFKSYTEKVWGVPCNQISAEWGAQRIKGLSVWSTLRHAMRMLSHRNGSDPRQKGTETSLIEQFLYPKFGPGQMWDEVARHIREMGGEIHTGCRADRVVTDGWSVKAVEATHSGSGRRETFEGTYFFSTAPVQEIVRSLDVAPPQNVLEVSDGLVYRDFLTVGLLVRSLRISTKAHRRARSRSATTGSTSRNPTSFSAGSRSSTTGARPWWPTRSSSGWASSISATSPTKFGGSPMSA